MQQNNDSITVANEVITVTTDTLKECYKQIRKLNFGEKRNAVNCINNIAQRISSLKIKEDENYTLFQSLYEELLIEKPIHFNPDDVEFIPSIFTSILNFLDAQQYNSVFSLNIAYKDITVKRRKIFLYEGDKFPDEKQLKEMQALRRIKSMEHSDNLF